MQAIDFYCKKCRKSMRISYALTGDRTAPAMNGIMIKCHGPPSAVIVKVTGICSVSGQFAAMVTLKS